MPALWENEETMKAWRLERLGGALTFEDVPVPEPRPHSVLVRVNWNGDHHGEGEHDERAISLKMPLNPLKRMKNHLLTPSRRATRR
jgi:hypothetical protein